MSTARAVLPAVLACALSVAFVVIVWPYVDTLAYDFDESWMMLEARLIGRGQRPFVDFAHHEPPLHLWLLALAGKVFGPTVFGFRMLSVLSLAAGGLVLFLLVRPFAGTIPALVAQATFLYSPAAPRTLVAVPETPMTFFTLLGLLLLVVGTRRRSAHASGVAFVIALLIKPTALAVVAAAAASLVWARAWGRLRDLAVAGVVASLVGLVWVIVSSDGVFLDILRFHLDRLGTRRVGMWSIESGFVELGRQTGIQTPLQLAVSSLRTFYDFPRLWWPMALLAVSALGVPVWIAGPARSTPVVRALAVLWPAACLLITFAAVDFTSPRYFVPYLAVSSFLLAGVVWLLARPAPIPAGVAAFAACVVLQSQLSAAVRAARDPWYYERAAKIVAQHPAVVSFTPMLFAATGAEPGCGFANPALTYGDFGETFLGTERLRPFRFSDERLIDCLRANPETQVVVDWAFYFFTRPGSALRTYLRGEGSQQRLFFSPEARDQWNSPELWMSPFR